jgi:hypothetical protein
LRKSLRETKFSTSRSAIIVIFLVSEVFFYFISSFLIFVTQKNFNTIFAQLHSRMEWMRYRQVLYGKSTQNEIDCDFWERKEYGDWWGWAWESNSWWSERSDKPYTTFVSVNSDEVTLKRHPVVSYVAYMRKTVRKRETYYTTTWSSTNTIKFNWCVGSNRMFFFLA